MAEIKKDITYIKTEMTEIKNKINDFVDHAPEKFADKKVEVDVAMLKKEFIDNRVLSAKYIGGAIVVVVILQIIVTIVLRHLGAL